jgi:heptosyltransferase III
MTRALVVRLDSDGDVLLAGPTVRAVAAGSDHVTLLVSPAGAQAGRLLPEVDDLLVWDCPWTGFDPPAVDPASVADLVARLSAGRHDVALVLTSYHQSSLPAALLLRLAGVERVVASSVDYPGSLLDVRHPAGGPHEVERGLSLARAAGFSLAPGDDDRLQVRQPLPPPPPEVAALGGYVVVHPSASVPARAPSPEHVHRVVRALARSGRRVVVTGSAADTDLAATVVASVPGAVDLAGRTTFAQLAAVLSAAECVVSGNTGPAHLAAAVGTPVVSLFAPVVAAEAWRPWGVPSVLLGDQQAPCAGSRARTCPVAGHPCLDGIDPARVVAAVERLTSLVAA